MSLYYETDPADEQTTPQLPPLLTGLEVEAGIEPLAKAIGLAAKGEVGVVCYSPDQENLNMAITLAPETAATKAVQMHYGMMIALGDAIGALSPPEVSVSYRFPGSILLNRGYAGECGVELGQAGADGIPDWMILSARLALRGTLTEGESGMIPEETTLAEEGGSFVSRTRLLESTCRHFLLWLNSWEDEGFRPLHDAWKVRIDSTRATRRENLEWMGLDGDGLALVKADGMAASLSLLDRATWQAGESDA